VSSVAGSDGLVIVGGGLSTGRAIKSYRESGGEGPITLFSKDSHVPYHRPPLSKRFLRGEAEVEDTLVEPEQFYRDHDVDLHLETAIAELDVRDRRLRLADGGEKAFDKLLIASGATPRKLDVPGADLEGIFSLRTLDDSARIREAAKDARHAVIVGAGFIGMEVAASLSQLGLEVTLVHRGKGLFEVLRARPVTQFLQDLYGQHGVELVLGDEVSSFNGFSKLDSVETKRGRVAQAELAVVGIGVAPWVDWFESSGLPVDDGVVVNERFETGPDGVWAVGDVARFYDPVFGKYRRIEHWSHANYSGTKVGELMAGKDGAYDVVSTFFSEVFGFTFRLLGDVDDVDGIVYRGSLEERDAIVFYVLEGRLVGALIVGQDEETENRLKELLARQAPIDDPDRLGDADKPLEELLPA
jgi:3-phenylpropionate/trans-cinnamate dioxygenase ferredoxin reductase component